MVDMAPITLSRYLAISLSHHLKLLSSCSFWQQDIVFLSHLNLVCSNAFHSPFFCIYHLGKHLWCQPLWNPRLIGYTVEQNSKLRKICECVANEGPILQCNRMACWTTMERLKPKSSQCKRVYSQKFSN